MTAFAPGLDDPGALGLPPARSGSSGTGAACERDPASV